MSNVIEFKPPQKKEHVPTWEELQRSFADVQHEVILKLRKQIQRERFEANSCMAIMAIVIIAMMIALG